MKKLIESAKDFKIIPANFKSAAEILIQSVDDNSIVAKIVGLDNDSLKDYAVNSNVEVFGVNVVGLIYFETKIIDRKEDIITLETTQDYSIIQRREYSRVELNHGGLIFKDKAPDFVKRIFDISAGGVKFEAKEALETDKFYQIEIKLSNNMNISCELQPIRIQEKDNSYTISGKFVNLENMDRIVLVQYAFKVKMEEQNVAE